MMFISILIKYIYFDIPKLFFISNEFSKKINSMKNDLVYLYLIKINIEICWIIFWYIFKILDIFDGGKWYFNYIEFIDNWFQLIYCIFVQFFLIYIYISINFDFNLWFIFYIKKINIGSFVKKKNIFHNMEKYYFFFGF
jgi:hypothetical protein